MNQQACDVVVAGGGPAGLAAACLLRQAGLATLAVFPEDVAAVEPAGAVTRTVALMQPAIRLLETLDIWPGELQAISAPLRKLRIIDDTGAAITAAPVTFDCTELGPEPFGWNIPLNALTLSLLERARALDVHHHQASVTGLAPDPTLAVVRLDDGSEVRARVVIAADGRQSKLRRAAGISTSDWSYDQVALALSFGHSAPHRDTSIEYHKPAGPFTTVPMPGNRSSLVWMVRPVEAEQIAALPAQALARRLQLEMHGELGLISDASVPAQIPMRGLTARRFAAARVLLAGEAAHVVPPIGAQGLNMSLRDAALAAEMIADAIRLDGDPGSGRIMADYDARRRADVVPRQAMVDMLNRSLTADLLPLHAARSLGLAALQSIPALRRRVMRQGLEPSGPLPRSMRA